MKNIKIFNDHFIDLFHIQKRLKIDFQSFIWFIPAVDRKKTVRLGTKVWITLVIALMQLIFERISHLSPTIEKNWVNLQEQARGLNTVDFAYKDNLYHKTQEWSL